MTPVQAVQPLLKHFKSLPSRFTDIQKLDAFLELAYCALSKPTYGKSKERQDQLEARYMAEIKHWPQPHANTMSHIMADLYMLNARAPGDYLGVLAAELGGLRSELGQFFTPWGVCRLMARMTGSDFGGIIQSKGYISMMEPASGSGAMVLAHAEALKEDGHNPETQLYVEATDLSDRAFRMCYVQLSLAGIPAKVIHGNTLSLEEFDHAYTPGFTGFLMHQRLRKPPAVRKRTRPTPQPEVRKRKRPQ